MRSGDDGARLSPVVVVAIASVRRGRREKVARSVVGGVARWRREGRRWPLQRGVVGGGMGFGTNPPSAPAGRIHPRVVGAVARCELCAVALLLLTGGSLGWLAPPDPRCAAEVAALRGLQSRWCT